MNVSALLTIEFLESELPCGFNTLSQKKPFHVSYSNNRLTILKKSKITNIHVDKLHALIVDVSLEKSFKVSKYYSSHKNVSYLLPIIAKLFVFLEEDLDSYFMPYGGWGDILFPHDNDMNADECFGYSKERNEIEESAGIVCELSYKKSYPLAEPEPETEHVITDVYYATNRKPVGGKLRFGNRRSKELNYGAVKVSIPLLHKSGNVERPLSLFKIHFKENKKKHICIDSGVSLQHSEFFNSLSNDSEKKSLMIFIHGYNVGFNEAIYKAAQIKIDLNYEYPFVLFSWPSQAMVHGYVADKEQAIYSSSDLAKLLKDIADQGIEEVLVLAHSMGSLCLAEAIKKLDPSSPTISKLALAAPDIEAQAYIQDYSTYIKTAFDKITLYASSKDKALLISKRVNRSVRLGDAGSNISVIEGIETVDMSAADNSFFSLNHSYVSESNVALTDIHGFLINSIPAKLRRLNVKFTKDMKEYWAINEQ